MALLFAVVRIMAADRTADGAVFPTRSVQLVVPWAAGGGSDRVGRFVADGLQKRLGKPVIVVNRTGGGGAVGHGAGALALPDGHTLTLATFAFLLWRAVSQKQADLAGTLSTLQPAWLLVAVVFALQEGVCGGTRMFVLGRVLCPQLTWRTAVASEFVLMFVAGVTPGLTPAEILTQVKPHLPDDLFPDGAKAGWWAKAVQLDLEAKGVIKRMKGSPVRLYRA